MSEDNIYKSIVDQLNKNNFTKNSLQNITKDQLKPILAEVYKEYGNLGKLEGSENSIWKEAVLEVINEAKLKTEETKKESNENFENIAESQEDKLNSEDYDDSIPPELPNEYIDSIHSFKIEKLAKKLENERKSERNLTRDFEKRVCEIKFSYDEQKKNIENDKEGLIELEKKMEQEIKEEKNKMKFNIKDLKDMKNDEFLLLLCLMRKKKEQMYENNPYIVDFSVTLDKVYQSKNYENVYNKDMEIFKVEDFANDFSKYVD